MFPGPSWEIEFRDHRWHNRWWGELPRNANFQANYIADFFENENLTFSQWLVWLRRWIWALDERMSFDESEIQALENRNLKTQDSKTIKLTLNGTWSEASRVWNADLNMWTINVPTATDNTLTLEADAILSTGSKTITIGTPPHKVFSIEAPNAIISEPDGLYAADLSEALTTLSDEVSQVTQETLSGATFNTVSSFGLSYSGFNQKSFFEKETGIYFTVDSTTTTGDPDNPTLPNNTFSGNIVSVYDKTGNLLSLIQLLPKPGNVIGNIISLFVSYSKSTGNYFIEVGCDNETLMAFRLNKTLVFSNTMNVNKIVSVTEFVSLETFNFVIGSEDTAIPDNGPVDDQTPWYNQIVTVWNIKTNNFLYGPRRNLYNQGFLTQYADQGTDLSAMSKLTGASADYFGHLVFVETVPTGQLVTFCNLDNTANTITPIITRVIVQTTAGGLGTTLYSYTKKLGVLEILDSSGISPAIYGCQILNQSKEATQDTGNWTILLNHMELGVNDSATSFVSGFGNTNHSIYFQLINSDELAINDLIQTGVLSSNFKSQIAGISMAGTYNINRIRKYGLDFTAFTDMPSNQPELLNVIDFLSKNGTSIGYTKSNLFTLRNSKLAIDRFEQVLEWSRGAYDPTTNTTTFDGTVVIVARRRVRLANSMPGSGGTNAGSIGEWVIEDTDRLNNRQLDIQDRPSLNLQINNQTASGGQPMGGLFQQGAMIETVTGTVQRANVTWNSNSLSTVPSGASLVNQKDQTTTPAVPSPYSNIPNNPAITPQQPLANAITTFSGVDGASNGLYVPDLTPMIGSLSTSINSMVGNEKLHGTVVTSPQPGAYSVTSTNPVAEVNLDRTLISGGVPTKVTDNVYFDFTTMWTAINNLNQSMQQILNQLNNTGAVSNTTIGNTTFNPGHNIVTGDLNVTGTDAGVSRHLYGHTGGALQGDLTFTN